MNENWIIDPSELEDWAANFFKDLYHLPEPDRMASPLPRGGFPDISETDKHNLVKHPTDEEIWEALKSMGSFKAPGSDGFQPAFFKNCWNIVEDSVRTFVRSFFQTGVLPRSVNDTVIALIGKVEHPEYISQFRPISLCSVLYKLITKILANRMKPILCYLIGPTQSSFLPGRSITDNALILQEIVHSMRNKKEGKKWMVLKLDLEKAYDRLRLDFVVDSMKDAGIPSRGINWIRECISSSSMQMCWNGELTDAFTPSRSIRQGDPISLYLFVLCVERLSHLISEAVSNGDWKPIRVCEEAPRLSHLFFADDILLMAEAFSCQMRVIMDCISRFCDSSGQKVSISKSKIFISKNVSREQANQLEIISGMDVTRNLGNYLGIPVIHDRVTKHTFNHLVSKVRAKLAGWKCNSLSLAGRLTLTKSVLNSLPVYTMNFLKIPNGVAGQLDGISRRFLWGETAGKRKMHLAAWQDVCVPKRLGGLGLRSIPAMNQSVLSKLSWRFVTGRAGIWGDLMKAKYGVNIQGTELIQRKCSTESYIWKEIKWGNEKVIAQGIRWNVFSGRICRFWEDTWLIDHPLIQECSDSPNLFMTNMPIKEFWEEGKGWKWEMFNNLLPPDILRKLANTGVDTRSRQLDTIGWKFSSTGEYSTATGYSSIVHHELALSQEQIDLLSLTWKLKVPERIRTFLWLVIRGKVITNVERFRRHLGNTNLCPRCGLEPETLIHLFHDCRESRKVWSRLVPHDKRDAFFRELPGVWVRNNLKKKYRLEHEAEDDVLFVTMVWWTWKNRNAVIFEPSTYVPLTATFVILHANLTLRMMKRNRSLLGNRLETSIEVCWEKPPDEWCKINVDGAVCAEANTATTGGLLRDESGTWIGGFVENIGICSTLWAELKAIMKGLELAWSSGRKKILTESDSSTSITILEQGVTDSSPYASLARRFQSFLRRSWTIRLRHAYREANLVADRLASHAREFPFGSHLLGEPPDCIVNLLQNDVRGMTTTRIILETI